MEWHLWSDDIKYKPSEDEGLRRSPHPTLLVAGKEKVHLDEQPKSLKPLILNPKILKEQKIGKREETQDKAEDEIELGIPLIVDPKELKSDEMDVDNLMVNSVSNLEKCFRWIFGEINFLKQGIKDIIKSFTENFPPNKTNKLLKLTQKIIEDIKVMKKKHKVRIIGWRMIYKI